MTRMAALDTVRAVAVLLVIGFHYHVPGLGFGFLGVDIFFVLSGFLITTLLVKEWQRDTNIRLAAFYMRRALRLFPALIVLLLVISPFEPFLHRIAALFYVANWATVFNWLPNLVSGYLNHIWSLSVEEQFYLIWPLILFLALRSRVPRKSLFLLPLALALASSLERGILWWNDGYSFHLTRGTDAHADGLFIGCTLALIMAYAVKIPRYPALVLVVISAVYTLLYCVELVPEHTLYIGGYTFAAITFAALLYGMIRYQHTKPVRLLSCPLLAWVGRISYGLYLWHFPVAFLVRNWPLAYPERVLLAVALTFATASLSYTLIELPALRLKDRLAVVQLTGKP